MHGPRFSLLPGSINTGQQNGVESSPIYYDLKSDPFDRSEWHIVILEHVPSGKWQIVNIGLVRFYYNYGEKKDLIYCFKPVYTKISDAICDMSDLTKQPTLANSLCEKYDKVIAKKARFCKQFHDGWLEDIILTHNNKYTNNLPLVDEMRDGNYIENEMLLNDDQLQYMLASKNKFVPFFETDPTEAQKKNLEYLSQLPFGEQQNGIWNPIDARMLYTQLSSHDEDNWKFLGCDREWEGFSGMACTVPPKHLDVDIAWKLNNSDTCFNVKKAGPSSSKDGFCQVLYVKPFQFTESLYGRLAIDSNKTHVSIYYDTRNTTKEEEYTVPTVSTISGISMDYYWQDWDYTMSIWQDGKNIKEFCKSSNLVYTWERKEESYTEDIYFHVNKTGLFSISKKKSSSLACSESKTKEERMDGDWGHPKWGGNPLANIYTEFVNLKLSMFVGKSNASSFVRKATKIRRSSIVDVETGEGIPVDDTIEYYSLHKQKLIHFLESDLGDYYNDDDWCRSEQFYVNYDNSANNGNKIANNNQLVWKKEFTDSNRKQLMKGHTCPNIYFRNWMRV